MPNGVLSLRVLIKDKAFSTFQFSMTISWATLPKELLSIVFKNANSKEDLIQLQLVCKNWSTVAIKEFYGNIILSDDQVPSLVKTLIESKNEPRFYVKSISLALAFCFLRNRNYNYDNFLTVLRLCPNINCIRSNQWNISKGLNANILKLHSQGYLQQLQYIPDLKYRFSRFKHNDMYDMYDTVAFALKSTLNYLIITTPRPRKLEKSSPNTSEINLLQHLQGFPRLKRLSVSTVANELLFETLMYTHKCADTLINLELELANSEAASQKPIRPMLALNKLSKKPNIKTLKIRTCVITTEDLQCVQYMFNDL